MKKNVVYIVIAVIISLSMLAGCGSPAPTEQAASAEPIKIGYIGPLTGDGEPWGKTQVNTLQMLIKETNDAGGVLGRPIELVYYDNRMDNIESTNAARKLILEDKVVAIIGTNASGQSIAVANVANEYKIPQIATNATNVKVTMNEGVVRPYTFRVIFTDPQLGGLIAKYAAETMGVKKAVTLFEIGNDYSQGVAQAFADTFTASGGEILLTEAYKTEDVDFRAQLSKIKEANPEAIFLPAAYKQIGLIAKQARELGITATFMGTDTWLTKDMLTLAAAEVEGATFAAAIDVNDPKLDGLKDKYRKLYGHEINEMGTIGFFAYDAYAILIDAIKRAGSTDPTKIRDMIETAKDVPGCMSPISIKPEDHNPIRTAAVMQIKDGKFITLQSVSD